MITSLQNPKVKEVVKLRERRDREKTGLFLIEGYRELSRALGAGVLMEHLFICPEFFLGENEESLISQVKTVFPCTQEVFQKISYRDRPDGLLAVAHQEKKGLKDLTLRSQPFFIVAEAIEKPGNLGTILRTADAVGADGVIVCDKCTDLFNPNVVRASVGTLFTVPVVEASSEETIDWLKKNHIAIAAATPGGETLYTEADFTTGVAIAFGTEQYGLSEKWLKSASERLFIPMKGEADSLNVAISTAVLLYEVVRQRG
jgi:TrmH family RNA methyltransferase